MIGFGRDLLAGLRTPLYSAQSPIGLGGSVLILGVLLVVHTLLQAVFALAAISLLSGSLEGDPRGTIKAAMIGILPAGLIVAALAYRLARLRGGIPVSLLALGWPRLGVGGWALVIVGFLLGVYGLITILIAVLGVDLSLYTPGENGASPETGTTGIVKEALFDLANEPLFWVAWPSVIIGAPLAEEVIFRGQIFAALAQSRFGALGATVVTSVGWALLHATEPWLMILFIFVMGLALGWLLIRFGSVWVTIVCHAVWNGAFSLVALGSAQT
jgi:membrane protease YdiL (CAAX protease family)